MQTPSCIQKALSGSNFPELLHEAAEADSDFVGLYLQNDMVHSMYLLCFSGAMDPKVYKIDTPSPNAPPNVY